MIDVTTILKLLDNSTLFCGIPHKILAPVFKQSIQISLKQGERLLSPGIPNEHVYIIISGQLGVHLTLSNMDEPLAILNPGECVGEMSVLVDSSVSAYVIAHTDCQLLAIGYSTFWTLIKGSNESARNMLNILVQRIRMGNETIADTLSQHGKLPDNKDIVDKLTGLYGQHGIQEKYDRMLHQCIVGNRPLCLIMLIVDEAKNMPGSDRELNNEQILRTIAQKILTFLQPDDCAARIDGNKFAILLANLPVSDVSATADRLRATLCQTPILLPDGRSLPPVNISAGVCKANDNDTLSALITKASQSIE